MEVKLGGVTVKSVKGDISELDVDAIVNAANSDLWMGSGVAGAIKRKGGVIIEREAMAQGPIRPGQAVITKGGALKARHVIHCAGMPPGGSATVEYVESSARDAMRLVDEKGIETVAFPAIGAGVGGITQKESINAILRGVLEGRRDSSSIATLLLVGYGDAARATIDEVLGEFVIE